VNFARQENEGVLRKKKSICVIFKSTTLLQELRVTICTPNHVLLCTNKQNKQNKEIWLALHFVCASATKGIVQRYRMNVKNEENVRHRPL